MLDLDISHDCLWPKGVSWPCPRSYLEGQGRMYSAHDQKPCLDHYSLLPCLFWIIFHEIVDQDLRFIMTFTKGHISKFKVTVYSQNLQLLIATLNFGWYLTQLLSRVFHDIDWRSFHLGHCTHSKHLSIFLAIIMSNLDWGYTSHNCPWPKGYCCGGYLSRQDMSNYQVGLQPFSPARPNSWKNKCAQ